MHPRYNAMLALSRYETYAKIILKLFPLLYLFHVEAHVGATLVLSLAGK